MRIENSNFIAELLIQQRQDYWTRLTAIRIHFRFIMFLIVISFLIPNTANEFYYVSQKGQVNNFYFYSLFFLYFARTFVGYIIFILWQTEEIMLSRQIRNIEKAVFRMTERSAHAEDNRELEDIYIRSHNNSTLLIEEEPRIWMSLIIIFAFACSLFIYAKTGSGMGGKFGGAGGGDY
jgi:hypothetical protein